MYVVSTNYNHAIAGQGFFQKGINSSVTLDQGRLAYKAVGRFEAEINAISEVIKTRVEDYNNKLQESKKELGEDAQLPAELILERDKLTKDVDALKFQKMTVEIGDEKQYRALALVIEQALKNVYELIQKANEGTLKEEEKAPNTMEFQWLQAFEEELNDAEKVKK